MLLGPFWAFLRHSLNEAVVCCSLEEIRRATPLFKRKPFYILELRIAFMDNDHLSVWIISIVAVVGIVAMVISMTRTPGYSISTVNPGSQTLTDQSAASLDNFVNAATSADAGNGAAGQNTAGAAAAFMSCHDGWVVEVNGQGDYTIYRGGVGYYSRCVLNRNN